MVALLFFIISEFLLYVSLDERRTIFFLSLYLRKARRKIGKANIFQRKTYLFL